MLIMIDLYKAELRNRGLHQPEPHRLPRPDSSPQTPVRHSLLSKSSRRMMVRLGDLLVDFGCRLQNRFEIEAGTTAC
jgi:hypothetical protein